MPRPHSDAELLQASEDVLYEATMMVQLARLLADMRPTQVPDERADQNARLESFTIHLRGVADFLYLSPSSNPKNQDDVLAEEYVPDWPTRRSPQSPALKEARDRCNKEIVHITSARLSRRASNDWDPVSLAREVVAVFQQFLAAAPPPNLHVGCVEAFKAEVAKFNSLRKTVVASGHPTNANAVATSQSTAITITARTQPPDWSL